MELIVVIEKEIEIYTDGACSGNPGPGGYGVVLIYKGIIKELSGGYKKTTNNRMELLAIIKGLSALKETCKVTLYSDSKYCVDAINKNWLVNWQKNNWRKSNKESVLNVDLWKKLVELLKQHDVTFVWVKGHADNKYNERCDVLGREFIKNGKLLDDVGMDK